MQMNNNNVPGIRRFLFQCVQRKNVIIDCRINLIILICNQ